MSGLTDRAEQLLAGITPGPWERRIGPPDQTPAEYIADTEGVDGEPLHIVIAPSTESRFAYIVPAITGNGPTSAVNAEFIAAAPTLVADLLAEVKRLTPREITTDAEVSMLPPGTILRDASGHAWYRGEGSWVGGGAGPAYDPVFSPGHLPFPSTVLYLPVGGE